MFYGEFFHTLNTKNQVTIPAPFREVVENGEQGQGFVLYADSVDCVYVYTPKEWERVVERAGSQAYTNEEERDFFLRTLFAHSQPCGVDNQGRILLPAAMKDKTGITKEVAIIGAKTRMEIWDSEGWLKRKKEGREKYSEAVEKRRLDVFRV